MALDMILEKQKHFSTYSFPLSPSNVLPISDIQPHERRHKLAFSAISYGYIIALRNLYGKIVGTISLVIGACAPYQSFK